MTKKRALKAQASSNTAEAKAAKYPRHAVEKALRIPRAIVDQNAGKECTDAEAAGFLGLKISGALRTEMSSGNKYGFLTRPSGGKLAVSERAKRIIRPQSAADALSGLREAILDAPLIADVYKHYRGENLPDTQFFDNALTDTFGVPAASVSEFKEVLLESLRSAQLVEEKGDKTRVLDVSTGGALSADTSDTLKKLGKSANIAAGDTCFVVMPFVAPLGKHYSLIYEPAIKKAGLRPVRADDEIFSTGKIMDQIWSGINAAKVLVAELTSRNPNVFYELGIAHALKKPVVLISANELDVPFDVRHIRVIYYDVTDPFWGDKLLNKVAENILSALNNPEEAIFQR